MSYQTRPGSHYPQSGWWDLFTEIAAMRRRLDQLLPDPSKQPADPTTVELQPEETDAGWLLEVALPGVPPEAVVIELTDRELGIQTEAAATRESGRRPFSHRLVLPGDVDADRVEARLEHGILTIELPRSPRATNRRIRLGTTDCATTSASAHPDTTSEGERTEPLPRPRSSTSDWPHTGDELYDQAADPVTAPPCPPPTSAPPLVTYQQPDNVTYLSDSPPDGYPGGDLAGQDLTPPEGSEPGTTPELGYTTQSSKREPSWLDWFSSDDGRSA